jgi:hypothetical protein
LSQITDRTKQDPQSGAYVPTGQTYAGNEVDKFLDPNTRCTSVEKDNNVAADFKDAWLKKWKDQIDDQSSTVQDAGIKGAPQASGDNANKQPLFG